MARLKSPEKRLAILRSAVNVIASLGLEAPTAKIAAGAGVAEGTLFTYFETKDALLNELYRMLNCDLTRAVRDGFPESADLETRTRHIWHRHLDWAVRSPQDRRVMAMLKHSGRITPKVRLEQFDPRHPVNRTMAEIDKRGAFARLPGYALGTLTALAETTAEHIGAKPRLKKTLRQAGFQVLWSAAQCDLTPSR